MGINKSITTTSSVSSGGFSDPVIIEKHVLTASGTVEAPEGTRAALITAAGAGGFVTGVDAGGSNAYTKFMYFDKINKQYVQFRSDASIVRSYVEARVDGLVSNEDEELYANPSSNTEFLVKSGNVHPQQYVEIGDRLFMPMVFRDVTNSAYYQNPICYWDLTLRTFVSGPFTDTDHIYTEDNRQTWWYDNTAKRIWVFSSTKVGYFANLDGDITYTSCGAHGIANPNYIYAKGDYVIIAKMEESLGPTAEDHQENIAVSKDIGATFAESVFTMPVGFTQYTSSYLAGLCFSDDCTKVYMLSYNISADYHDRIWKSSDGGLTFTYGTLVDILSSGYSNGSLYKGRATGMGCECSPDGARVYWSTYSQTTGGYAHVIYTEATDSVVYANSDSYASTFSMYTRDDDGNIIAWGSTSIVKFASTLTDIESIDFELVSSGINISGRYNTSVSGTRNVFIDDDYNALLQNNQTGTSANATISVKETTTNQAESTIVTVDTNTIELKGGFHATVDDSNGLGGSVVGPALPYAEDLSVSKIGLIQNGISSSHASFSSTRYPKPAVPAIFEGLDVTTQSTSDNENVKHVPGRGAGINDFDSQTSSDMYYMGGSSMSCFRYPILCAEGAEVVCTVGEGIFEANDGIVIVEFVA